jgi:Transposase DDE domain
VLYDLTSTYFEGRHFPLTKLGHSRDDKSSKLQIVFGLLTNASGCPVAVEVFAGNTSHPKTVAAQVTKLRQQFGLSDVVLIGDCGMITSARIREDLPASHGIQWISAQRATQIQKLATGGQLQMSLFDQTDLVEIVHPDFPGERLIVCFNPLLAEERARKRPELLGCDPESNWGKLPRPPSVARALFAANKTSDCAQAEYPTVTKWASTFSYASTRTAFTTNGKAANIEREENLDGMNLCHPDQRQKGSVIQPAGGSELQKLIRRGAGLPQFEDRRSASAADPSPPTGSRLRPHPTLHVGLLCGVAYAPTLGSDPVRRR